jgi:predicted component of type VI protein secretion system
VLANDVAGSAPLNVSSVTIVTPAGAIPGVATVDTSTGTVTFVPNPAFVGTATIEYQVCDTSGLCGTGAMTVRVAGPPVVLADSASTSAGAAVAIAVLANDQASDATVPNAALDVGSVRVTVAPPATEGTTLVDSATGKVTFVPASGFVGTSTFEYEVCDSSQPVPPAANCGRAQVTVMVAAGPTANTDTATTTQNHGVTVVVLANDVAGSAPLNVSSVTIVTPAGAIPGVATVDASTGTVTFVPSPAFVGTATIEYQVCDTSGLCGTGAMTVRVAGPPVVLADSASTSAGAAVAIAVLANDQASDATVPNAALDVGSVRVTVAPPATEGTTLVDSATGKVTFVPASGFVGTSTFEYEVCDSSQPVPPAANCGRAQVTVMVAAGPTANTDTATTTQNHGVTVVVLANDVAGSAPLNVSSVTIVTPAGAIPGVATVDASTGTVTFVPSPAFVGTATIEYQVCDTSGLCGTGAMTVRVAGPPVVLADSASTSAGAAVAIAVLANDQASDATVPNAALDVGSVRVTVAPPATEGTTLVDSATGKVTFVPASGFVGTSTFEYEVCDSSQPVPPAANCGRAQVTVMVAAGPTANTDTATTTQNHGVTVVVLANDVAGSAPLNVSSVTIVTPAGAIAGVATVDASTGTVTFVPNSAFVGTATIEYQVCDTSGLCGTGAMTVRVAGPPVVLADSASTSAGAAVAIAVLANDQASDATVPNAALDVGSVRVTVAPPATEGTTLVDSATGKVTFVPASGFVGTSTFEYEVCDSSQPVPPAANCGRAQVTVMVAAGPTANTDTATTTQNHGVTVVVLANDVAGSAPLNVSSVTIVTPAGAIPGVATVDASTGTVTFVPSPAFVGTATIEYQVCDTSGLCGTGAMTVRVAGPPVVLADSASTSAGAAVAIAVLANDQASDATVPNAALDVGSVRVTVAPPATEGTTLVDSATGKVTFVPASGFVGTSTFEYEVCDSSQPVPPAANCGRAQVTVMVAAGPTANTDTATTTQNHGVTVVVLANDVAGSAPLNVSSVTIVTPAGAIPGVATVDASTGTVTFVPSPAFVGTATIEYQVCDTSGLCGTGAMTVRVAGPPVVLADSASTSAGAAVAIAVLANDQASDATVPNAALDVGSVRVTVAPPATEGTTLVDSATGKVTFVPASGFVGTSTFEYEVCDSSQPVPPAANCGRAQVTVMVAAGPTANTDTATTTQNHGVTVVVLANDVAGSAPLNVSSVTIVTPAGAIPGVATVDASTGTVTFVPSPAFVGTATIEYQVCDTSGLCGTGAMTVRVAGPPVVLADSASTSAGAAVAIAVLANDQASDATVPNAALDVGSVRVTVAPPATEGTTLVDSATGKVTFVPASGFVGTSTFEYEVCDSSQPVPPAANCGRAQVTVMVAAGPTAIQSGTSSQFRTSGSSTTNPQGATTNPQGATTNALGATTNAQGATTNPQGATTNAQGVTTNAQGVTTNPQAATTNHQGVTTNPQGVTTNPQGATTNAQGATTNAQGATTNPQGATTNPQGATTNAQGATTNAQGATTNPQGATTNAQGVTTNPQGVTTNPQGATTNAQGATTNPQGATTNAQGATTNPQGATTNPQAATTNHQGVTTNPQGATTNAQGATTNPQGATTNAQGATTNPQGATTNPQGATTNPQVATTSPTESSSRPSFGPALPCVPAYQECVLGSSTCCGVFRCARHTRSIGCNSGSSSSSTHIERSICIPILR